MEVAKFSALTHFCGEDSNASVKGAMSPTLAAQSIIPQFDGQWIGVARIEFDEGCFLRFAALAKHYGAGMRWVPEGDYHLHIFLYQNSYYGVYTVDKGDYQILVTMVFPGAEIEGIKIDNKKAYEYCTISLNEYEIEEQFTEFIESACVFMKAYIKKFREDYNKWKSKQI